MRKVLLALLFLATNSWSALFSESPYTIHGLDTLSYRGLFQAKFINDQGQVCGSYDADDQHGFFVYSQDVGLVTAFVSEGKKGTTPRAFNNSGQVAGVCGSKVFLWNMQSGFKFLDPMVGGSYSFIALTDAGDVILQGREHFSGFRKYCLWNGTQLVPFSEHHPLFKSMAESGASLKSLVISHYLNENLIAGHVILEKVNPFTGEAVGMGERPFVFDGSIWFPIEGRAGMVTDLNASGLLVLTDHSDRTALHPSTMVGNVHTKQLQEIPLFSARKINSQGRVLGEVFTSNSSNRVRDGLWNPVLSEAEPLESLLAIQFSSRCSDSFFWEEIWNYTDINSQGDVVGNGIIWTRLHPFVARPRTPQ